MDELTQLLGGVSLSTIILVITAVTFLWTQFHKIYKVMIDDHDKRQEKEESLKGIKEDIQAIKSNQENLEIALKMVQEKQEEISKRQEDIEQNNREYELNKTKDRLMQLYHSYTNPINNPTLKWTSMEKDVFDRLFSDYEKMGGNGYMHTIVMPAMNNLDVIDINDLDAVKTLWETRKG